MIHDRIYRVYLYDEAHRQAHSTDELVMGARLVTRSLDLTGLEARFSPAYQHNSKLNALIEKREMLEAFLASMGAIITEDKMDEPHLTKDTIDTMYKGYNYARSTVDGQVACIPTGSRFITAVRSHAPDIDSVFALVGLEPGTVPLERQIQEADQLYASIGMRCVLQLTYAESKR